MRKLIAATFVTVLLAGPAMANQCPTLMKKIDDAMATTTLDDAGKAKVTELYNKGKAEHEAGKHDDSVATLNEALKLLGM